MIFEVVQRHSTAHFDEVTLRFKGTLPQPLRVFRLGFSGHVDITMVAQDEEQAREVWSGHEEELPGLEGAVSDPMQVTAVLQEAEPPEPEPEPVRELSRQQRLALGLG